MKAHVVTIPFTPGTAMVLPVHIRPDSRTITWPLEQSETVGIIDIATTGDVRVTGVERVGSTLSFAALWLSGALHDTLAANE